MPNHIINTIRLTGDRQKISELLESVKDNRFGIGSLDFNKVIPMPESLQIETSSSMERGLKAYKEFVDICTFDGANKDMDLLNIPEDKENIFLRMREDVKREEWELGRQAFRNEAMYGAPSWYDWSIKNWGTKWNSYGYDNLDRSDTVLASMRLLARLSQIIRDDAEKRNTSSRTIDRKLMRKIEEKKMAQGQKMG